jgi:hypothetical protein
MEMFFIEFPILFHCITARFTDNSTKFSITARVPEPVLPRVYEIEKILGRVTGRRIQDVDLLIRKVVMGVIAETGVEIEENDLLLPWVVHPKNESDIIILSALGITVNEIGMVKAFLSECLDGVLTEVWMKE